jgi:hypothetical protein
MTVCPPPAEMLAVAEAVAEQHPDVAALLRDLAEADVSPDHKRIRQGVLRRIRNVHFVGMSRNRAAEEIAEAWATFRPLRTPLVPGSLAADLDRLHRYGFRPIGARQIFDVLDPVLDA